MNYRKPLLTGFNSRDYKRLWHRGATCPKFPSPCDPSAATGNNDIVNPLDGAILWLPGFRDSMEDRRQQGENGTVVSLDNNIAVPLLFAALADRSDEASYMDCLQGQGALLPHPVCRFDRPLSQRLGPEDDAIGDRPSRFRGLWTAAQSVAPPPPPPPAALTELLDNPLDGVGEIADSPTAATIPEVPAVGATPAVGAAPAVGTTPVLGAANTTAGGGVAATPNTTLGGTDVTPSLAVAGPAV